jgi:hypothetical protein
MNGYSIPDSIVFVETLKSCYITFSNIKNSIEFYRAHKAELFIVDKSYKMEYSSVGKELEIQKKDEEKIKNEEENSGFKDYHEDWQCESVSLIY